jgi:hypothetical protein
MFLIKEISHQQRWCFILRDIGYNQILNLEISFKSAQIISTDK